jgi:hypothetical protein
MLQQENDLTYPLFNEESLFSFEGNFSGLKITEICNNFIFYLFALFSPHKISVKDINCFLCLTNSTL